ncbi:2-dehydropantoate 2-reductase [Saccharopolyspora gloriosae]|uniref:2-dehydropantoate 2-reductase n=1 Tax=Saccharopolyspora gloriosae TaxID=455344 RepID=A0A840N823_9PSEU|nr:2-dehydropantoate 2-reductase [Saccharopolyspora gloriosae]
MRTQRIAVIGGGAVGGALAAAAQDTGHEVVLCVRTPFEVLVLDTPDGRREVPVRVITDPAQAGPVDWVLVATKVQDVGGAGDWLSAFDAEGTPVVAVQNGVEHHDSLAPLLARSPVLPALLYGGAERVRAGHVRRHSAKLRLVVPAGTLGERLRAVLCDPEVTPTDDFRTETWRKMLTNLAANPISALTMRRLDVFADGEVMALAKAVVTEGVAVARAEGAELGTADADRAIEAFEVLAPGTGTSMLYDREAGLRTEHEHITGALVRAARRHGIPVPRNETLLTLLRALPENR